MTSPPQRKTTALPALLAVVLAAAVFLIPAWLPADLRDQWGWIIVIIQGALTMAMVAYLVWFVRKQRDDYWRERGKDPRHPER